MHNCSYGIKYGPSYKSISKMCLILRVLPMSSIKGSNVTRLTSQAVVTAADKSPTWVITHSEDQRHAKERNIQPCLITVIDTICIADGRA